MGKAPRGPVRVCWCGIAGVAAAGGLRKVTGGNARVCRCGIVEAAAEGGVGKATWGTARVYVWDCRGRSLGVLSCDEGMAGTSTKTTRPIWL